MTDNPTPPAQPASERETEIRRWFDDMERGREAAELSPWKDKDTPAMIRDLLALLDGAWAERDAARSALEIERMRELRHAEVIVGLQEARTHDRAQARREARAEAAKVCDALAEAIPETPVGRGYDWQIGWQDAMQQAAADILAKEPPHDR